MTSVWKWKSSTLLLPWQEKHCSTPLEMLHPRHKPSGLHPREVPSRSRCAWRSLPCSPPAVSLTKHTGQLGGNSPLSNQVPKAARLRDSIWLSLYPPAMVQIKLTHHFLSTVWAHFQSPLYQHLFTLIHLHGQPKDSLGSQLLLFVCCSCYKEI